MGDKRSRERLSRAERRGQLLAAAIEAIREHGPQASMEQLAAKGGVTKPILYRHFRDRDGLLRAIGEHFAAQLFGRLLPALDQHQPQDMLRATIDAYLAFIEDDPAVYAFVTTVQVGAHDDRGTALVDALARQIATAIGDQLRAAGADAGPAEPYAFGIVGMVHQAGDWWLRTGTMTRAALTEYLCTLLWGGFVGLAPAPAATAPPS